MPKKTTDPKAENHTGTKKLVEPTEPDLERPLGRAIRRNPADPGKGKNVNDRARPFVVDGPYT